MNHIFGTDGKTFILAMDHGSNFNVLPAMRDAKTLIRELAAAGADAFLSTIGMAENFAGSFLGKGIILRIDGGVSFMGDHKAPMQIVATAEDALRLGADSVITMSFPGSVHEAEVLSNLARVCLDCHKWGMPGCDQCNLPCDMYNGRRFECGSNHYGNKIRTYRPHGFQISSKLSDYRRMSDRKDLPSACIILGCDPAYDRGKDTGRRTV